MDILIQDKCKTCCLHMSEEWGQIGTVIHERQLKNQIFCFIGILLSIWIFTPVVYFQYYMEKHDVRFLFIEKFHRNQNFEEDGYDEKK